MEPVIPIKIKQGMRVKELVENMQGAGFGAGKIAKAAKIMDKMFKDKECKVFLGLAGAMVPAGMKEIILDILDHVDVFVTTGANLTHDLIEALGDKHYLGKTNVDDKELNKQGIDRIYNIFMKNQVYEKLESFFEKNFSEFQKCKNIKEFIWKIGELCPSPSILKKCWEKKIPIFCPAIADSGIGLMIWGRLAAGNKINIDPFDDMKEIISIGWEAKRSGVIYVAGGTPKNFIQQSLQFSRGSNYGVQITTSRSEPGGSSGAPLQEGISWGKMKADAEHVDIFCDATIALPLVYAAIK